MTGAPAVQVLLDNGSGSFPIDVTELVVQKAGVTITRGRQDEFGQIQPSTASLTFDNSDGRFSPGAVCYDTSHSAIGKPRNFLVNGGLDANIDGWVKGGPGSEIFYDSSDSQWGTAAASGCLLARTTVGTTINVNTVPQAGITPGLPYSFGFWAKPQTGASARSINVWWNWLDANGATIAGSPFNTAVGTEVLNTWTQFKVENKVAPAGAVSFWFNIQIGGVTTGTEYHKIDSAYFSQSTTTPAFWVPAPAVIKVDTPIKIYSWVPNTQAPRFTGFVNSWPTSWPTASDSYSEVSVTCSDRLARLSRRKLRSPLEQSILKNKPAGYYLLSEPEGSTAAGDTSGTGLRSISATAKGAGAGTITFAASTGPAKDGHAAPTFAPTGTSNGLYLAGNLGRAAFKDNNWWFRAAFSTSTVDLMCILNATSTASFHTINLSTNGSGRLQAVGTGWSITDSVSVADGQVHEVAVIADAAAGLFRLYRDGVQVGTTAYTSTSTAMMPTYLEVGGGDHQFCWTGSISHVAMGPGLVSAADVSDWWDAGHNGFNTESSDARIARYASWANISLVNLEAGKLTATAHQDTSGMSVYEAMSAVAASEQGIVFDSADGLLTFHSRAHRYAPATAISLTGDQLDPSSAFAMDQQGLINHVTAARPGGTTQTFEIASSVDAYEQYPSDLSLLVNTDDQALEVAGWIGNTHAEPEPRLPAVTVDLFTQSDAIAEDFLLLELGSVISLSSMPPQSPLASSRLFIEGWTEVVTLDEWTITFNTSRVDDVWVLEDPIYGAIDSTNRLAY